MQSVETFKNQCQFLASCWVFVHLLSLYIWCRDYGVSPVKAASAFAPPMETQDFNLNTKVVKAQYTDYEAGMDGGESHA